MKRFLAVFFILLVVACSKNSVGHYQNINDEKLSLKLLNDGTFLIISGFYGKYFIQDKKIFLEDGSFGKAEGTIDGNKLIFPQSDVSETAKNAAGVWEKQ